MKLQRRYRCQTTAMPAHRVILQVFDYYFGLIRFTLNLNLVLSKMFS